MIQWIYKDNIRTLLDVTWNNWGDHIKVSGSGYRKRQNKLHTLINKLQEQFMSKDMFQDMFWDVTWNWDLYIIWANGTSYNTIKQVPANDSQGRIL